MSDYKYLIIGGGMAADAAAKGIRSVDPIGSIGMISAESNPPYKRPPLSKGLWRNRPFDSIFLKTEEKGVSLHLGRTAAALDASSKTVTDDAGDVYSYEKLLIATGGDPRKLDFQSDRLLYYRFADDYLRLRDFCENSSDFVVIGGGFIGTEVAAALAMNGKKVTVIYPEPAVGARIYPMDIAEYLVDYFRKNGVDMLGGESIANISDKNGRISISLHSGKEIAADCAVAGIGLNLNTVLAADAGLPVENGIKVDEFLAAGHPDIFAAGDVAQFYNPVLDKWLRPEHEDNALRMGETAGKNMAGQKNAYHHLPFFYSDLFDVGYEAVGELDPNLEIFADWKSPYEEGVIYYLKNGRVRGVLLWNVWDRIDEARSIIAETGPFSTENLKGRITAD